MAVVETSRSSPLRQFGEFVGSVADSVEWAGQGGHPGPADAELRRQLALRWGLAVAITTVQVGADDRVVSRHGRLVWALAGPWLALAMIQRYAALTGSADQSNQRF